MFGRDVIFAPAWHLADGQVSCSSTGSTST